MSGLLGGDKVARWDDEASLWVVTGWTPGPAGASGIELEDGLTVLVDHARPWLLSELVLEAPLAGGELSDEVLVLVERLLGGRELEALLGLRGAAAGRPLRLEDPDERRRGGRGDGANRFILLAGMAEELTDPRRVAVAQLEAVRAAAEVGLDDLAVVGQLAERGLAGSPGFSSRRPKEILMLEHEAARRLGASDPLRSRHDDRFGVAALRVDLDGPSAELVGVQGEAEPVTVDPFAVDLRLRAWLDEGHLQAAARQPEAVDGLWLRAVERSTWTSLAWAPFLEGSAYVVVPTHLTGADISLDVTDDPAGPVPSATALAAQAAVVEGRRAARYDRMGRRDRGARAWEASRRRWAEAGDEDRAGLASAFSQSSSMRALDNSSGRGPASWRLAVDAV